MPSKACLILKSAQGARLEGRTISMQPIPSHAHRALAAHASVRLSGAHLRMRQGRSEAGGEALLPLVEAEGDKAEIALTLDQKQDGFASGFLGVVNLPADIARVSYLLLRGFHDQVAGTDAFGGSRAVLGDIDDDDAFRIIGKGKPLLQ